MSFNVQGAVQLPLTVFGGLVTEMVPSNLPEGVSPDNQDVVYVPGSVASRPGFVSAFATPFGTATVTYAKSYVDPTGIIRNLYFDSEGNLWVENVTATPGIYTLLTASTPGCYAKSTTAFGREYIAINDGLHGQEVPLQLTGQPDGSVWLDRVTQDGPGAAPTIVCVDIAPSSISSLSCTANVADCVTSSAHGLLVGYQALLANVANSIAGTSISSIVIDNEQLPGLATVTTSTDHGLAPGGQIIISGVEDVLAPSVSAIFSAAGVITVVTSSPHGLSQGSSITIEGCGNQDFNGSWLIALVVSPIAFAMNAPGIASAAPSASGVTVLINWPLPDTGQPAYFEVIACPSSTTFQIQFAYTDGTWTSGTVYFSWNGTFFVSSVISATEFTYQFFAPTASATITGPETVTPFGQAAPGQHQMQVLFLTRNLAMTRPSPPVLFTANGGQYLSISNIPIGPPNVVARILAFTGALGDFFFYIPTPAQENGQQVSTDTQINDNTTTAITLDFSDNTLFAALSINTPGNNLPNQIVLDGALSFGFYDSRLITMGQRNRIQNLLNMGFDGGYFHAAPTIPTGWTPTGAGGSLAAGHYGLGWQITDGGQLSQSFYEDAYGAPIGTPNASYIARAWLSGDTGSSLKITIGSILASFTSTAVLPSSNATGAWVQVPFNIAMPATIPPDMTLTISGTAVLVDELSILYAQTPYLDTILYGSYVNNPEGIDGVSGVFGPSQDARKVMDFGIVRDTLYLLTQDPSGRLHASSSNSVTEPAGWSIQEVAANCGVLSAYALTRSQADDSSASGGEEWLAWASTSGARIFGGDQPWKISQEIQPDWANINPAAVLTVWALNDPVARVIYFGLPLNTATAPNLIYPVDYKELDTAYQIATSPPVHVSFTGKLIASDHTRKWTRWNAQMNGAALMYWSPGLLLPTFFGGNGQYAGQASGYGNVYIACANQLSDDDYGQIHPYYTTYFFPSHDQEQQLALGGQRKTLQYFQFLASGVGTMTVTPLVNNLQNPWNFTCARPLTANPDYDLEWPGASATGQRIAFKFASSPSGG